MVFNSYKYDFLSRTRLVRMAFLLIYLTSNIYAYVLFEDRGELIGDYLGVAFKAETPTFYLLTLTVASYFFICGPFFLFASKIRVKKLKITNLNLFSYFLFLMQCFYCIFNITSGTNAAGSDFQSGGITRLLWLLLPVDYLFYIYYFIDRKPKLTKMYMINIIIFIVSMVSRGWLGWVLVLFYAELCFLFYKQSYVNAKINIKCFVFLCLFLLLAPIAFSLKMQLRSDVYTSGISGMFSTLANVNYFQAYNDFIYGFFSRIQQLSNVVFFYDNKDVLGNYISSGLVSNYGWEGLPQQTIAKMLGVNPGLDMHLFLYNHYISSSEAAVTTLQVGFISWFFTSTLSSIMYPFYIASIIGVSVILSKKLGGDKLCALTWIMIFLSIMCGWFNAYLIYLQALITFYIILGVLSLLNRGNTQVIYDKS